MRTASAITLRCAAIAGLLLMLSACGTLPSRTASAAASAATFLLVPNAETDASVDEDPPLSRAGQTRAATLAQTLAEAPLVAIYTDEFRRTQQTAARVAALHPGARSLRYFSRGPAEDSARQWRAAHPRGTVLVVAQPATLAPLADALCGCSVRPLRSDETSRLLRIHLRADGPAQVQDLRDGAPIR